MQALHIHESWTMRCWHSSQFRGLVPELTETARKERLQQRSELVVHLRLQLKRRKSWENVRELDQERKLWRQKNKELQRKRPRQSNRFQPKLQNSSRSGWSGQVVYNQRERLEGESQNEVWTVNLATESQDEQEARLDKISANQDGNTPYLVHFLRLHNMSGSFSVCL